MHIRGGVIKQIYDTLRSSYHLYFVLIHLFGHDGWHLQLKQVNRSILDESENQTLTSNRVTTGEFYAYYLQIRSNGNDYLFRLRRLFQEYCCVQYAKCENQKLDWLRTHQSNIRAELYNNIYDAVHRNDVFHGNIGRHIIHPPSSVGSDRDMHRRFQDAMAIVRHFNKPDLFITFTCNLMWREILDDLFDGQKPHDRPDVIGRVFKIKLQEQSVFERPVQKWCFL